MAFDIPSTIDEAQYNEAPETVRNLYSKKEDGKFHFDAVPKRDLHKSMDINRTSKAEYEARLKTFDGLDPEEARTLIEDKRKREAEEAAKKGDASSLVEKERNRLEAKYAKERSEYEAKLNEANQREARYVRNEAINKAALAHGVLADAIDMIQDAAASQLSVKDGVLVDKEGDKVDASKWVKDFVAKRQFLLGESTGGGTKKGSGGVPSANLSRSKMTSQQKADYIKLHSQEAYMKLPA